MREAASELSVIGAGNMAEAIVRGLMKSGVFAPGQIVAADVSAARRALFQRELNVRVTDDAAAASAFAKRILLSVKPQQMGQVLGSIAPALPPDCLIISIAAGIGTGFIERTLGRGIAWRIVRAMPNTPMLVGAGMAALCPGGNATADDLADARRLFASSASVLELAEAQMDAVTAVSGSGPAYVFYLVEQMIRAGVALGLSAGESRQLAVQTALGAARMLAEGAESPEELRRKVTSPGGTTAAAMAAMESAGVGDAIIGAIHAAAQRSRELGV